MAFLCGSCLWHICNVYPHCISVLHVCLDPVCADPVCADCRAWHNGLMSSRCHGKAGTLTGSADCLCRLLSLTQGTDELPMSWQSRK